MRGENLPTAVAAPANAAAIIMGFSSPRRHIRGIATRPLSKCNLPFNRRVNPAVWHMMRPKNVVNVLNNVFVSVHVVVWLLP
jgi:hypothetical protein